MENAKSLKFMIVESDQISLVTRIRRFMVVAVCLKNMVFSGD